MPTKIAACSTLLSVTLLFAAGPTTIAAQAAPSTSKGVSGKPIALRADALTEPLGIDTAKPELSWKLQDKAYGAKQTAYQIQVFSKRSLTKPDVWDSGKVPSDTSAGVAYGGPELLPEHRYFWRVKLWDKSGKPYPASDLTWWETGLLSQSNWHSKWIGYEPDELHTLRASGALWLTNAAGPGSSNADTLHDFRYRFTLDGGKAIKSAILYATGEDTVAAWVNGQQALQFHPLPPWKQMPWMTYQRQDVTSSIQTGDNVLAIEVKRYLTRGPVSNRAPMSSCLYIVYADGSSKLLSTASPGWKAALGVADGWQQAAYDDASWMAAEQYKADPNDFNGADDSARPWPTAPVAALRHAFMSTPVVSARLYATALGAYKFHINGAVVGNHILAPGWMDFREHVAYQVYDVTAQIKPGKNAIAAYLAPGWYSTPLKWFGQGNNYGETQPALRAQLRLEHADGSVEWINTDESWRAEISPILKAEIYDGETRDARKEAFGWDTASFADTAWKDATLVTPKDTRIVAQYFEPIREQKVLTATKITQPTPGVYVFDFGQNMTALPRLRVHGSKGQDIQLRFAEVLNADGTMYTDNLRTAKATDHFILAGKPAAEDYQPLFTFHGFRYAEITGLKTAPTPETLKAVVLHTDAPFTTKFATGDKMVNQLWSNVLWGQRSNFIGVPTDCPQRDERLGWSADAQVFWRTATYNMDLTSFSQKYAADLQGTQVGTAMYGIFAPGTDSPNPGFGAAWSDAGVIVPWTGWIQSGDRKIVDQNWNGMERYLAALEKENPDHLWRKAFGAPFGDWLTPTITTPEDLLATAYWAYDATLMKQMALATGRTEEAEKYAELFTVIKAAFQKAYVRKDGFVGTVDNYPSIPPPTIHPEPGGNDKDHVVETQTGYVLALYMDLLPDELRAPAANRLIKKIKDNNWLLGTGFLGTPYLLAVLSDTGHSDVAYRLLLAREYPSWGYLIDHGATTTWERWNGDQMRNDPSMNSYNHYAYGAVAEWMYRYGAGIDTMPENPGFHTIYLHPNFDARLGHLDFDYESTYGKIHSGWTIQKQNVTWTVTVPPNTTAMLPLDSSNATSFLLDGAPLADSKKLRVASPGHFELAAGTYKFTATLKDASETEHAGN